MAVNLNVTELDFDLIKNNIKSYLSAQGKYNDYDFEGSGLSILLDILAYNTHYNAMTAHLALNEAFLDSAQIRGNVVSHAKLLGYIPRSSTAPTAYADVVVNSPIGTPVPATLTLSRGAKLITVIDGEEFGFVVADSRTVPHNLVTDTFTFENVAIKQGTLKIMTYRIDEYMETQKFEIPDEDIDTTTIRVRIKANDNSTKYDIYTQFTTLSNIDSTSKVYFIQENSAAKFEIYFGDGIIGSKPTSNNIVEVEYVYTGAEDANGARTFEMVSEVEGNSNISVTTISASAGGSARESIESIRFNSPLTYITQNRAVTADDYKAIIQKEYGDIEAISVWGGEDASPPDYGKVFISIKPLTGEVLSAAEKEFIINNVLKSKNVVSITPVMIDPQYTYIKLEAFFKYNPNLTDRTRAELQALVSGVIKTYNDTELKRFDGVFRYSKLLRTIDKADPAILNSYIRVYMFKTVTPSPSANNYYDLEFASPIYTTSSSESVMTSTSFLINGIVHYFADAVIPNSNDRRVYMYKVVNGNRTTVVTDAGRIYTTTGRLVINNFKPDDSTAIIFTVTPNSNDLAPKRNQLLSISMTEVAVTGEVDTIAVSGSAGTVNYTTTSRHK
jgi:hypothetical protein